MKSKTWRTLIAISLALTSLVPAFALRPSHLPQTVGEQFLQGLQLRDFDYARERVLPEQLAQFAVFESLVQASGWIPSVRARTDFELLDLSSEVGGMIAQYAIGDRGSIAVGLVQLDGDWYVDLAKIRFSDGKSAFLPQGSLKVSQVKPMERARAFLEAFIKLDLVQAASYGTENTKAALLMLESLIGLVGKTGGEAASTEVKMMSEKIEGEKATVEYRIGAKPTKPLALVRQGGNWMVDVAPGQTLP